MSDEHTGLLLDIERKDRRFRMAQSVFMALLTVALVGLVWVGAESINKIDKQSQEGRAGQAALQQENLRLQKQILALQQQNVTLAQETKGYIKCVALFFARSDRANAVITDLDKCEITDNGVSFANPSANGGNSQGSSFANPQNNNQNATTKPEPETKPPASNPPAATAPPDPPFEILGIPVCIPLTGLCIR